MDQCRFFDLPSELRDMIYSYVRTIFATAIGTGLQPILRLNILLVSKQVYKEYRDLQKRESPREFRLALPQDGKLRYRNQE